MLQDILNPIANFLVTTMGSLGYFGIFVLMTIESTFLPFVPTEFVLLPAGFLISIGKMSFVPTLIFAVLGSLTGALINYYLALHFGRRTVDHLVAKYGKFLFINKDTLLKSEKYFDQHGAITTLVGRLVIGIRQYISLPAGFARMNIRKFCIYTSIGAGIYSAIFLYVGYFLGNNLDLIKKNLNLITYIILLVLAIIVLLYVIIKTSPKRSAQRGVRSFR